MRPFEAYQRWTAASSYSPAVLTSLKTDPALIEKQRCWFDVPSDWPAAECGTLHVPEDHLQPGPRMIQLPFVVFRSSDPTPDGVPVVVAGGGGPGSPIGIIRRADRQLNRSVWEDVASMSVYGGRDLILIDNRGVGSSVPQLDCPEVEDVLLKLIQTGATETEELIAYRAGIAECRQRLTETEGIDISKYNVVQAAHDLEALRRGFGVDSLNLYGVSYGTRVAMVYAREFPTTTRAMVLDSVDPPQIEFYEEIPTMNWRAFERVFQMCTDDERCRTQFGDDLQNRFETFLENQDGRFIELTMTNPITLKPMQTKVSSGVIVSSLYSLLYAETDIPRIPLITYTMMKDSFDYLGEIVREEYVGASSASRFDEGAYASYNCYDEVPFNDTGRALREAEKYPIQKFACWGRPRPADSMRGWRTRLTIVTSEVPGSTPMIRAERFERQKSSCATAPQSAGKRPTSRCPPRAFARSPSGRRTARWYPTRSATIRFMNRGATMADIAMCDAWNVPAGEPVEAAPVRTSVPTLLLSGALDPVTPPEWAADSKQYLSHSYHIVWPGIGHGILSASYCADEVARVFLDNPDRDPSETSCIDDPQAPIQFIMN